MAVTPVSAICDACGEPYFNESATQRLVSLVCDAAANGVVVDVRRYAALIAAPAVREFQRVRFVPPGERTANWPAARYDVLDMCNVAGTGYERHLPVVAEMIGE